MVLVVLQHGMEATPRDDTEKQDLKIFIDWQSNCPYVNDHYSSTSHCETCLLAQKTHL
ncbi:MAG: hypothetical protein ACI9JM_000835 [Halioglobus sp.]|jgi:hypothetical protein